MAKIIRRSIDNLEEKKILALMIDSTEFLNGIQDIYDRRLFRSSSTSEVSYWCIQYYSQYKKAPQEHIEEILSAFEDSMSEEDFQKTANLIMEVRELGISGNENVAFYVDTAENYLKLRQVERLRDQLTQKLVEENPLEAERLISEFRRVEKPAGQGVDLLHDRKGVYSIFSKEGEEVLFRLPGRLKDAVGSLSREDFLAVTAPMKRGKTWWLIFFATLGLVNKHNVLFVSMEMSEAQMVKRIYQNMTGLPRKDRSVDIPFFDDENEVDIKTEEKEGLSFSSAMKKVNQLKNMVGKNSLRLLTFPTKGVNVEQIESHMRNMEHYENFVPDVVVVDYADILAPEHHSSREVRHQLDDTWGALRKLAQVWHCLVITGSQSTRRTLSKDIGQEDLAEDIRKLAHVTHMIGLNQTVEEKRQGIMRVNVLASRHDEFFVDEEITVLQQMAIGRPYLDSRSRKELDG